MKVYYEMSGIIFIGCCLCDVAFLSNKVLKSQFSSFELIYSLYECIFMSVLMMIKVINIIFILILQRFLMILSLIMDAFMFFVKILIVFM